VSTCHRRKAGRKRCQVGTRCRVGTMSLATSCNRERKGVGSGWRKMSFDRRRCGRETGWREREQKWKRKAGGSRKHKGFPLHPHVLLCHPSPLRHHFHQLSLPPPVSSTHLLHPSYSLHRPPAQILDLGRSLSSHQILCLQTFLCWVTC